MSRNNNLSRVFAGDKKLLSVFTTAGFPVLRSIKPVVSALEGSGVDFIELGFPFSDPVADGATIQHTSEIAIKNGMNLKALFEQLAECRKEISLPIILMGYLNPIIQFGMDEFFKACTKCGVDGVIIPDLPLAEYKLVWKAELEKRNLSFVFLVTPQTSDERIRELDSESDSFIYAVSSQAVTGGEASGSQASPEEYYKRLLALDLKHPVVVGFGISDKASFDLATKYHRGAIIGSAFLRALGEDKEGIEARVSAFIQTVK